MHSLPIIDFAPFLNGTKADKKRVALAMRNASKTIGFFMLKNIGIPNVDVNNAFKNAKSFFDLPNEVKQQLAWQNAESNRGYIAVRRETLDPTQKSDLKEAFNLGTQKTELDLSDKAKNKWPASHPDFRNNIEPFIEQCTLLSFQVLRALAVALDIDEDYFCQAHDQQQHTFRLLHYPALAEQEGLDDNESRAGAHTDYGSITLLFQDDVGGLEVKSKEGHWVAASPAPETIVVNIGDLMQRWTNDVFCSNPHRVKQPEQSRHKDRYSIAYFCTPNKNQIITCLPTCCSPESPAKYPPITTQDHMLERLNRTY